MSFPPLSSQRGRPGRIRGDEREANGGRPAGCGWPSDDDAELVRRLRTHPQAIETFYRRHVAAVAAFVARRVTDADSVADVVSNTFLAAIQGSTTLRRGP